MLVDTVASSITISADSQVTNSLDGDEIDKAPSVHAINTEFELRLIEAMAGVYRRGVLP